MGESERRGEGYDVSGVGDEWRMNGKKLMKTKQGHFSSGSSTSNRNDKKKHGAA